MEQYSKVLPIYLCLQYNSLQISSEMNTRGSKTPTTVVYFTQIMITGLDYKLIKTYFCEVTTVKLKSW